MTGVNQDLLNCYLQTVILSKSQTEFLNPKPYSMWATAPYFLEGDSMKALCLHCWRAFMLPRATASQVLTILSELDYGLLHKKVRQPVPLEHERLKAYEFKDCACLTDQGSNQT